jgi:hypothetical protein
MNAARVMPLTSNADSSGAASFEWAIEDSDSVFVKW